MQVKEITERISRKDARAHTARMAKLQNDIKRDEAARHSTNVDDWLRVDNDIEGMKWRGPADDRLEKLQKEKLGRDLKGKFGISANQRQIDTLYQNLKHKFHKRLVKKFKNRK